MNAVAESQLARHGGRVATGTGLCGKGSGSRKGLNVGRCD